MIQRLKISSKMNRDIQDKAKGNFAEDKVCPAAATTQFWQERYESDVKQRD